MSVRKMVFGLSTRMWSTVKLCERHVQKARDSGYDSIEIFKTSGHFDGTKQEIQTLKAAAAAHGVTIDSMHSDLWLLAPPDRQAFLRTQTVVMQNLEVLAALEGRFLVIHLGVFADPQEILPDPNGRIQTGKNIFMQLDKNLLPTMERIKEGLALYAQRAKQLGVKIALETDVQKNEQFLDFLAYADPTSCGLCFDSGHAHVQSDAVDLFRLLGKRVICTHLHDNDGKTDRHLPPYMGTIDWEQLMDEMIAVDYREVLTFECGKHPHELAQAKKNMNEYLNKAFC